MTSEKHLESLQRAIAQIRIADHMIYVTYPVIKDKRLLLKTIDHIYEALILTINSILQYDFLNRRINLYKNNPQENFEIFIQKCARRYNITPEELNELQEVLAIVESHKKSPMEFLRKEQVVILSESLKTTLIDAEKLKKYLGLAKKLVEKTRFGFGIG